MEMILVTGAAGFIGFHVAHRLLAEGRRILGVDNMNDYYDVHLKETRLALLQEDAAFRFARLDIADRTRVASLFAAEKPATVIHLAAQAGVRYSLVNPHAYIDSNVTGQLNILEGCRHYGVRHLIFASSSSVYGANTQMPFSEHHGVDHPVSLYAATKRAGELMAHTYASLFAIPCTGLRFFTVYGPWGRPDMAMFLFTRAILAGEPIDLYNEGHMERDFTYVDDVVEGVVALIDRLPSPAAAWNEGGGDPARSFAPFRLYNIGGGNPVALEHLIALLEAELGRTARKNLLPMQPGDVPATYADCSELLAAVGVRPTTSIAEGVRRFVRWYREYYRV